MSRENQIFDDLGDQRGVQPYAKDLVSGERRITFKELFPSSKHPLIGMIHLPQLPGYDGQVVSQETTARLKSDAVRNLQLLHQAGFEGVMVENNGDNPRPFPQQPMPYQARRVYREVMSDVVQMAQAHGMRTGVHIGYDPLAAIEMAHELRADFVRVDVFADDMTHQDEGIMVQATPQQFIQRNRQLESVDGHRVLVFADVQVKHFTMKDAAKSLDESVRDTIQAGADGVVITGKWTGLEPNMDELLQAKTIAETAEIPVVIGSGVTADNVQKLLGVADGAIVGTSIKTGGNVDGIKAEHLAQVVKAM